ncbi:uncharacterized protein LOC108250650 [Kryptolebias marmoratus]|uniref:uncharacterized protein LOC108250650 n=1 Tax=Kryptolebias marmoratus TaxID=37003 RepID=UPI0018AC9711|nr:uncharacterized protein LOC108250650 [Kryptolebias marmoratus]
MLSLYPQGHYEVHGDELEGAASFTAGSTGRFSFMRMPPTSTSSSATHLLSSTMVRPNTVKTFQRSLYIAEVSGGRLMVVIRFLECGANLQRIIGKVQDAIKNYDPMVLTDTNGNAILESEGTTGSQYWKQNARKIFAVPEQEYQELQGVKKRRMNRKDDESTALGDITSAMEELILASQSLLAFTAAVRELTDLAATQRVILTAPQLQTIEEGLSCVVCLKFILDPVFSVLQKHHWLQDVWSNGSSPTSIVQNVDKAMLTNQHLL